MNTPNHEIITQSRKDKKSTTLKDMFDLLIFPKIKKLTKENDSLFEENQQMIEKFKQRIAAYKKTNTTDNI